jgi:NAD(P)-dependent dehydrogenase (short-subunit alcohol dehydrogenase family)
VAQGRVAAITGAGSGIGRAAAIALAEAGFRVAALGRRRAQLEETAALASKAQVTVIPADVTDPEAVDAAFGQLAKRYGRLDLLFNNAGCGAPGRVEDLDVVDWRRVIDTNLTGAFLCARAAVRQMKRQAPQGGRIINNGSISAHSPRPASVAYTASKHAITGLTRALALDGRAFNIACGQIDIGNAATDMTARMARGVVQADGSVAPEPTFDAAEVGRAVAYMASLPLDANVLSMTVMATRMPFVGRG